MANYKRESSFVQRRIFSFIKVFLLVNVFVFMFSTLFSENIAQKFEEFEKEISQVGVILALPDPKGTFVLTINTPQEHISINENAFESMFRVFIKLSIKDKEDDVEFSVAKFLSSATPLYKEFIVGQKGLAFPLVSMTDYVKDLLLEKVKEYPLDTISSVEIRFSIRNLTKEFAENGIVLYTNYIKIDPTQISLLNNEAEKKIQPEM